MSLDFRFDDFFRQDFLGNDWERWLWAAVIFLVVMVTAWAVRAFLTARLRKLAQRTDHLWDDVALLLIERTTILFVFLLALHLATKSLDLGAKAARISSFTFFLVLFVQVGVWLSQAITFLGNGYANRALERDAGRATTIRALVFIGQILAWTLVVLLLLDNWGVKVAPFIAGLGIGGVAIALAVQNILGDLFASLSIVLDKPFVIGDPIGVGAEVGTVEHIGLKTTRLRSLSGEQLIFSNSDLLQSRVRNFKRMRDRRVQIRIGILYETPADKLDRVRDIFREAVEATKELRFERAHLANFGASALEYELVYWVNSPDYNLFVELQHRFSVELIRRFQAEGIEFAYPTQKVFVDHGSAETTTRA